MPEEYTPPDVWTWDPDAPTPFRGNRPIAGATFERDLPRGKHPFQLHSMGTPNGQKVTILFEELLAAGHEGAEYDAWLISIMEGDQFGSGFVSINPNSKIPALVDRSGPEPVRVFESGAILVYLAEKTGQFLPSDPRGRSLAMQWLMWQMAGFGPMHGQAHHFLRYAPGDHPYATERYTKEARRLMLVLNRRLGEAEYLAGTYSIADISTWPWVRGTQVIDMDLEEYPNIKRWFDAIGARPGVVAGQAVSNASLAFKGRIPLTPEQWSNLFGSKMHANAED